MMFNVLVKFKLRKCVLLTAKLKIHSKAKENFICQEKLKAYQNLISTELNVNEYSAEKIITKKHLSRLSLAQLKTNCVICRKYNVKLTNESETSRMLVFQPLNIHHRILLFKECGAENITDESVGRFYRVMKMGIEPFKQFLGVPENVDIVQKFFETSFPKSYEPPPLKNLNLQLPFKEIRMQLLFHYVLWRFQMSEESLIGNSKIQRTLVYKSLTMINETVEYLLNEFGWDIEQVKKRQRVSRYEINNIKRINESLKTIGDCPINEVAYRCPAVLSNHVNNITEILAYLQEMNIPVNFVRSCMRILTMQHVTVKERTKNILKNPDLCVFRNHPRFLWLVNNYENLEKRVNLLNSMNASCVNLHSLICSATNIQRLQTNAFNLTNRVDLKSFLDYEIPIKNETLDKELQKNPNWLHISLQQISETMQYLKQHFSIEDIRNNIQILLYHHTVLESTWKFVQDQYGNYEGYQFTTSQKLALCLYHLELPHHFTGNSILITKTERKMKICINAEKKLTNEEATKYSVVN